MADTCLCCKLGIMEGYKDPVTDHFVCEWCWEDHWGKNRTLGTSPPTHVTKPSTRAGGA